MERLFSVGQLMPCYVQGVEKGRVSLSVSPALVNSHLSAKDIKPKLVNRTEIFVIEGKNGVRAFLKVYSVSPTASAWLYQEC